MSLILITDPFGVFSEDLLRDVFDLVRPYKTHYVTDLNLPIARPASGRHRRNTARAFRAMRVEVCGDPPGMLDEWTRLYAHLASRHHIRSIKALSPAALAAQLAVPGLAMFKAVSGGEVIGLHLWYVMGEVAYGHLGATSRLGYDLMASYALYATAIEWFRGRVRWLDLGSSAGTPDDASGRGLRAFKAGWSTSSRPTFLCGR
ncbi:MAG: GNAT family N-acetyltransferase, partial [Vicinamibacterales bacterium]